MENLRNQTLNNIEIILTLTNSKFKEYKELKNICLSDKRIKLKIIKIKDPINILFSLMELLKGKFVLIIYKYFNFTYNDFEKFYNYTKGKIKNIYKFKVKRESLFLIKSKILRDINDNKLNFKNCSNLIEYITSLPEPQLNYIPVALSTSNNYISLAYICMRSILYSKLAFTYISFYILISKNFTKKNIAFLKSLYDQYDYFNITILELDNRYDKAFVSSYITKETYFRFSLGELIPHLNKLIYIDNDVIIFKDLTNLYNLNFNNKIILGQPIHFYNSSKIGKYRINAGILLLNLKKMREIKMEKKILNILINKREEYNYHDQSIINKYFKLYLGDYPPENHARPYNNNQIILFNNKSGNLYNNDYFLFSWKYPTMRHYLGKYKPGHKYFNNNNISEDWWYFARLSKYFVRKSENINEIFNYTLLN
jgi:lipopolysaccharide biosynthesis glycosyltransferase